MVETSLTEFVRYNNWANRMVLEACQHLSEQQLAAEIPGAYGTISQTLKHLIEAEAFYVSLLKGDAPKPPYKSDGAPTVDELRDYRAQIGPILIDLANGFASDDMVDEVGEGWELHYRAVALFIQVINHGIEHRTNITTVLNQGLQEPPEVDGWAFLWAHPDRFDIKRIGEE